MASLRETKIMQFSAKQIYDLVIDIEKYSEFLPWCKKSQIIQRINYNNLQAELLINFKNFFEKYTSDVHFGILENGDYFVDVIAIKGPFKSLVNKWRLTEINEKECLVDFYLEFEFNSKMLSAMLSTIFASATQKMIFAFEQRAKELYVKC
jgi:coenzyme Q-binding protein COQ10